MDKNVTMKILGIGNAIVDVICKVDENFIKKNKLNKGTMKLIFDIKEFQTMLSNLNIMYIPYLLITTIEIKI